MEEKTETCAGISRELAESVVAAADRLSRELVAEGVPWTGELSASALSTATAVSALSLVLESAGGGGDAAGLRGLIEGGLDWLAGAQNEDGGWGDTDLSYSNISTSMLVLSAWQMTGADRRWPDRFAAGESYVERAGGVEGIRRRYGRDKTFAVPILANAALAGRVDWREVSALPFEAACVPQSWYRFMQLPVVSYAIPALVAIGQAKYFRDPPWNPLTRWLRWLSVGRSLKVLRRMQPESGGYLEAIPLTSFVMMALAGTGRAGHAVVKSGVEFLRGSVRGDGSWPIDTNLATWNTSLSLYALDGVVDGDESVVGVWQGELLEWLLGCQHRERHPFTGAAPGGWGWSDLSGAVPDADDTPAALLALAAWKRRCAWDESTGERVEGAVQAGLGWLLDLQNRDGGWPTFCRGWGKLPFDRSGSDLTAHAMRAIHVWGAISGARGLGAIERGWRYLERQQRGDGSWLPLWFGNQDQEEDENPVYGTVKVLLAYRDLGRLDCVAAQRGLAWLVGNQNADGSFGGGVSSPLRSGVEGLGGATGSVEETALAVEILWECRNNRGCHAAAVQGLEWLCGRVASGEHRVASPIGFYFAKLWYHERLYPLIFSAAALARVAGSLRTGGVRSSS